MRYNLFIISIFMLFLNLTKNYGLDTNTIPLTLCDKRYILEMQRSIEEIKKLLNFNLMPNAEAYMVMLKQHKDLDYLIRKIEQTKFSEAVTAMLRRPLNLYNKCGDGVNFQLITKLYTQHADYAEIGSSEIVPTTSCDKTYVIEMQKIIEELKNKNLQPDIFDIIPKYMIIIKQHHDLDVKIREMEKKVFSSQITAILRRPLLLLERCELALDTHTYTTNIRTHY